MSQQTLHDTVSHHSDQIAEIRQILKEQADQIKQLQAEKSFILAERLQVQQLQQAKAYLYHNPMLKMFHNHLMTRLTGMLIVYHTLATGLVPGTMSTTDQVVNNIINIAGNFIPLIGSLAAGVVAWGYNTYRALQDDVVFQAITHLFPSLEHMSTQVEAIARLTTFRLEAQINKLADVDMTHTFSEHVFGYYLSYFQNYKTDNSVSTSLCMQSLHALFIYEPEGLLAFLRAKTLKTNPLFNIQTPWTVRALLKDSVMATKEGVCYSSEKGCKDQSYAYRLGTDTEAQALGYIQLNLTIQESKIHLLHNNPFRYQERIQSMDLPPVLTWEDLLNKLNADHSCVGALINLTYLKENDFMVLQFPDSTLHKTLLLLSQAFLHESLKVSDVSIIGHLTSATIVGSHIHLEMSTRIATDLLSILLKDQWLPASNAIQPSITTPLVQTSLMQTPLVQTSLVQPPLMQTPLVQTSLMQAPLVQTSLVQTSLVQTSLVQTSLVQPPLVQPPLVQTSLVQTSLVQTPLMQTPLAYTSNQNITMFGQSNNTLNQPSNCGFTCCLIS